MRSEDLRGLVSVAVVATVVIGAMSLAGGDDSNSTVSAGATSETTVFVETSIGTITTDSVASTDASTASTVVGDDAGLEA